MVHVMPDAPFSAGLAPSMDSSNSSKPVNTSRVVYRSRQFWRSLTGSNQRIGRDSLLPHLSPVQILLFQRMHPSEQAHAFQVLERLKAAGESDPDLLTAALLHDVGKILSPLSTLDRVLIVLARHFVPDLARRWGEGVPRGFRRPFVVAKQHPAWGAELAAQAGATSRTVSLISSHQADTKGKPDPQVESLLAALQAADDSA